MIKLLYFARLREQLGVGDEQLSFEPQFSSVETLAGYLAQQRGEPWQALLEDNVVTAVNQTVVPRSHTLRDGDELAFYPPVTGG